MPGEHPACAGASQLVPETMVDPQGQLAWCQLAGQHSGGKCSRRGFLSGNAARWVEGEAQFVECRGQEVGYVVVLWCCRCGGCYLAVVQPPRRVYPPWQSAEGAEDSRGSTNGWSVPAGSR